MDYNKLTKAQIIEIAEEQQKELAILRDEKISNQEQIKNSAKIQQQNDMFLKGSKEKDRSIQMLQDEVTKSKELQAQVFQQVQDQANQKVMTVTQQNVAIAKEYEFAKNGMADFVETVDDIMEYHEAAHKTIKNLVKRLKSVYTEEE